ncbi:hypothetical protein CPB83DRAFT_796716 [Crepidotus variabilis]|uniref:Fe2OG dioxygenase domain-containing protein n=1 Tax=Crepidotus variabilis TaxID=179855 RepID=A0A9P6E9G3_9AGAR|nr:hypothetical protein CPB83DRAFT_796716 [Crepidotus variabilis]
MLETLAEFKELVQEYRQPPFSTGVAELKEGASSLFYAIDASTTGRIDFANVTDTDLEKLAAACQPATFGRNQEDVLDEGYRKAGKLDAANISVQFTPHDLGVVDVIYNHLLRSAVDSKDRPINVEIYKLNVYGPGAFFKPHVDTPRSDKMFGSLVVVLPTVHEGGSLIFHWGDEDVSFDSAQAVKIQPTTAAFAVFASDIEHEVAPVTSGYRVTLTYNLYWEATAKNRPIVSVDAIERDGALKESLQLLLKDPEFLPDGGALGFALNHKYPFNPDSTRLQNVLPWLKGPDAGLRELCKEVSLEVSLKAVYFDPDSGEDILLDYFFGFNGDVSDSLVEHIVEMEQEGLVIYDPERVSEPEREESVALIWARPLQKVNRFHSAYAAYGNEASLEYAYGEVCLVATIPPASERIGSSDSSDMPSA